MFSFFRKKDPGSDTVTAPPPFGAEPSTSASATATTQADTSSDAFDWSALMKPADPPAVPAEGATTGASEDTPIDPELSAVLQPQIVAAIGTVFDPEIPVNIYELGLIYDIEVRKEGNVHVKMTLTSPACPSAQQLPAEVEWKVKAIEGVSAAKVEIVWDPPWTADKMSEAARLQLGMF